MSADASRVSVSSYKRPDRKALLILYLPIFALLFLVVIGALATHMALSSLTRDMAAIAHVHPLTGVVTNVGAMLWCAAAVICLFSSSLLRQRGHHPEARFLMWAGLMTIVLLVDDLFMFHEYLAPVHFHLNEKVVLASYACAAGAYLLSHRRLILEANYHLLVAAMVMFSASILVDLTNGRGWWNLLEDSCKLLGIASWLGYHAGMARHWLVHAPDTRSQVNVVAPLGGAAAVPLATVDSGLRGP